MEITVNYPARTIVKKVKYIKFNLANNTATVELLGEHPEMITIDLSEKVLTSTKLKTIREFIAQIIADASGVKIEDIPQTEILKKKLESKTK